MKTFSGHEGGVSSVSLSADYTKIASGSGDWTIRLWDIETGKCYHTIGYGDTVDHVRFSPTNPQYFISISENQIQQWNTNGNSIKPPFDGSHVSFSSDGTQFVSYHDKTVTVHDSSTGATVIEFQMAESAGYSCSFSPDSRFIAVAAGRTVYCWNITNSKPQLAETFIGHTNNITSLLFSSPTTLVSASIDKSIKFWHIGTQPADPTMPDLKPTSIPSAPIESITLQTKDSVIITSDSDGIVKTWDISTGVNKTSFQTPFRSCSRDIQLINNRLILVWFADKMCHVWDVGSRRQLLEFHQNPKLTITVRKPTIWTPPPGNKTPMGGKMLGNLRISGDGLRIFYKNFHFIQVWSIQTGEVVGDLESYAGPTLTVSGSKVWVYGSQSKYQGWDFGISGSIPTQLHGMPSLSNGSILWDPSQGRIKNAVTGGTIFQLSGRFANPTDVQCDDSYLVAGYESGEILILELKHVPP